MNLYGQDSRVIYFIAQWPWVTTLSVIIQRSYIAITTIILLTEQAHSPGGRQYGATGNLIIIGQSKAKRRVFAFLTVFVMTGGLSEFGIALLADVLCVGKGYNADIQDGYR